MRREDRGREREREGGRKGEERVQPYLALYSSSTNGFHVQALIW